MCTHRITAMLWFRLADWRKLNTPGPFLRRSYVQDAASIGNSCVHKQLLADRRTHKLPVFWRQAERDVSRAFRCCGSLLLT
jgi:hypothetical protein